jgi:hypothetical protein
MASAWLMLVKKKIAEVKKEGKAKGKDIIKEGIKRAKAEYKKKEEK